MFNFKKVVTKYLRERANDIDAGTSEISESEAIDILRVIAHESMSKSQACSYLNLSVPRFDELVRLKQIPNGRKVVGFKEKRWYQDELDVCLYKIKKNKKFGSLKFNV